MGQGERKGEMEKRGGEIDWIAVFREYKLIKKPSTERFHIF
jgi:hypothetical protein